MTWRLFVNQCLLIVKWKRKNTHRWNLNQYGKIIIPGNEFKIAICRPFELRTRQKGRHFVDVIFKFDSTWLSCLSGSTSALVPLQWRHNERDDVSNHQPHDCLLNLLFRRRSKKASKLRVTGLCAGNSPLTGEFPAQKATNAEIFPFDDVIMSANRRAKSR